MTTASNTRLTAATIARYEAIAERLDFESDFHEDCGQLQSAVICDEIAARLRDCIARHDAEGCQKAAREARDELP